jgi:hypothetical protein
VLNEVTVDLIMDDIFHNFSKLYNVRDRPIVVAIRLVVLLVQGEANSPVDMERLTI